MILKEHHYLLSELTTLERLISKLPESSVIEKMSLEARLNEVKEIISAQQTPFFEPARVRLTFRGKPVVKNYGIFTEFAATVLDKFVNMVAAVGASQNVPLGTRGMIPNREDYRLIITGTTPGSFGFELEEAPRDEILISPVKAAIEQTMSIMESAVGSDDDLADAIAEVNPRAIEAMRAFLGAMVEHEALCLLEIEEKKFQFDDVSSVRITKERLSQDNIHEEDKELIGMFQGVLPTRRTFEFSIKEEDIIVGKVGLEIEDASKINHVIEKPMKIQVHKRQVGTGQPRYVLLGYKEMGEQI
ncbi:MAG: hypothetical protein JW986_06750 [Methanotrichaceae archaeon]|nr:hypothetical protein [Methanotrichaceae archaeon]